MCEARVDSVDLAMRFPQTTSSSMAARSGTFRNLQHFITHCYPRGWHSTIAFFCTS